MRILVDMETTNTISISKLPHAEHYGDWHDKPVKWVVNGPGEERQKFTTIREAIKYTRIRRQASSEAIALQIFSYL